MLKLPCKSYADDTVVLVEYDKWSVAKLEMNGVLRKFAFWFYLNKLTLNLQKIVLMTFGLYPDTVPEVEKI